MRRRHGADGPPQPTPEGGRLPQEVTPTDVQRQVSEGRLAALRQLGRIHDDLKAVESFRKSSFGTEVKKEEVVAMYRTLLGQYRPFLNRVRMNVNERNALLEQLSLTGIEEFGPSAVQATVVRLARTVERALAKAIHTTQAEKKILRDEEAARSQKEFAEMKEPKMQKIRGEVDVRDEQDVMDMRGDRASMLEAMARHVNREEMEPTEVEERPRFREPEDPIKVAFADERRVVRDVGTGDPSTPEAPPMGGAEFDMVEEEPTATSVADTGALGEPTPTEAKFAEDGTQIVEDTEVFEPLPDVDLGEPTDPFGVLRDRVRQAVESKYRRHFNRPKEEVRSWGAIVEGKASALKTVPGAEVFGIVNEKPHSNEDRVAISKDGLRFAAIDGMGGHGNGEVAAEVLARHMIVESEDSLPLRAEQAYRELKEMGESKLITETAGACFAAVELGVENGKVMATIAHAGDVKVIVVGNDGSVRFVSRDFSVVQNQIDEGKLTEDQALYDERRSGVASCVAANEFPLPPGDKIKVLLGIAMADQRAGGVRNAINRLWEKGLSESDRRALHEEIMAFYNEGEHKGNGMGLSTVELQEGDTLYAYTDGISDNLTVKELQEALKKNNGHIADVLESIRERIQTYRAGGLGTYDERAQNGVYKDGLRCKPKEDDQGFLEFRVTDLAALHDYVRKARGGKTADQKDTPVETEPTPIDVAATGETTTIDPNESKEPPTMDAEFELVEPEDNGERGVVLADPDVVDAEFDERTQLAREAIELAGGGGGQEPPRDADSDFEIDEDDFVAANDAGGGGAGVIIAGAAAAAAAAGGGGGGATGRVGVPLGRGAAGRVHGSGYDLFRGLMSYEFGRTVKRWTHAAGTVAFDWSDSLIRKLQDIAHSASFSWLPFGSKWSKEDRDSITDLKPEDKKKAA